MNNRPVIYLDNHLVITKEACIAPDDCGFLYGEGLFETLRAEQGCPVRLERHLRRLRRSLDFLGLPKPARLPETMAICQELLRGNGLLEQSSVIKIIVSRRADLPPAPTTLIVTAKPLDLKAITRRRTGMRARLIPWRRDRHNPLLGHKSLNYLENRIALRKCRALGFDEGIFLNQEGELCEGSFSNIFLLRRNTISTPPTTSGLLPGIIREVLLEQGVRAGLKIRETRLRPSDLQEAEGAFLSSSLMGIAPLTELAGQTFNPDRTSAIRTRLDELLSEHR